MDDQKLKDKRHALREAGCVYCSNQAARQTSIIGRCCDECLAAALIEWDK